MTDLAGKPIAGVRVALYAGNWYDAEQKLGQETLTDERGEYRFEKLKIFKKLGNRTEYFSQVRFEHPELSQVTHQFIKRKLTRAVTNHVR